MVLLKANDHVALVGCSNGLSGELSIKIEELVEVLEAWGLQVSLSPYLYARQDVFSATAKERAKVLMDFYKDNSIKTIFDISGGDVANQVLPYLDFECIQKANKPYFGYSDLTTIINGLYTNAKVNSYLYQIRFLVGKYAQQQQVNFYQSIFEGKETLFKFDYHFLKGEELEGTVVGGNIRCLLKLAGTPYLPNFKDKILFLEGMSGKVAQMTTFLNQYQQMGILDEVKGILLGSFSEMEEKELTPTVEEILLELVKDRAIPIVKTKEIGHGQDAKCLRIGEHIHLRKEAN